MSPDLDALVAKARDSATPFCQLLELSNSSNTNVLEALLDNPNICLEIGGVLNTDVILKLAIMFPEKVEVLPIFQIYSVIEPRDEMVFVVARVIEKTSDVGLITQLFVRYKEFSRVRQSVARNVSTPAKILQVLADPEQEPDWFVREEVASNTGTPVDVLRNMGDISIEPSYRVRHNVVKNKNAPDDLILSIYNRSAEDPDVLIASKNELLFRKLI